MNPMRVNPATLPRATEEEGLSRPGRDRGPEWPVTIFVNTQGESPPEKGAKTQSWNHEIKRQIPEDINRASGSSHT